MLWVALEAKHAESRGRMKKIGVLKDVDARKDRISRWDWLRWGVKMARRQGIPRSLFNTTLRMALESGESVEGAVWSCVNDLGFMVDCD